MNNKMALDIGYSSTKIFYNGKLYKIPTAISFAGSNSLDYGENKSYEFAGERYIVGRPAENSFVTTDFNLLNTYTPLIIYHACKVVGAPLTGLQISTGLAVSDWTKREEFMARISSFNEINGEAVNFNVTHIMPQGAGAYYDFMQQVDATVKDQSVYLIDIGYNTINSLYFENGKPVPEKAAARVGSGVMTIIKDFAKWLENKYNFGYSDQEALKEFMKSKHVFQGIEQTNVTEKKKELKKRFVKQLFKSILVQEKKLITTSETVIIAGGGVYLLQNTPFPPNVKFVSSPYEFSNVRGYAQYA